MRVHCLFDADSIIKNYINLPGSGIVKHIFEKSPTAQVNILDITVPEVLMLFYYFEKSKAIRSSIEREQLKDTFLNDIKTEKIKLYSFSKEHILDFKAYDIIASEIAGFRKERVFSNDIIFTLIAREMRYIDSKSAVVTSAIALKKIAGACLLTVIDPQRAKIEELSLLNDVRMAKRCDVSLKAMCWDCQNNNALCVAKAVNLSNFGVCLEMDTPYSVGKELDIRLSSFRNLKKAEAASGKVVWSYAKKVGVMLFNPVSLANLA